MAGGSEALPAQRGVFVGNDETSRAAEHERTERARRKQALELQRENILSQRTSNAGRRAALEAALKQIEDELVGLG